MWQTIIDISLIILFPVLLFSCYTREKRRRKHLLSQYKDELIVEAILLRQLWISETDRQVIDSFGHPQDIKINVFKDINSEMWSYCKQQDGSYGIYVFLENGKVIGWEKNIK